MPHQPLPRPRGDLFAFPARRCALTAVICGCLLPALALTQAAGADGSRRRHDTTASRPGVRPGTNVGIHLRDGSIVYGRLERLDADSVVVATMAGRVAIPRPGVRDVRNAGAEHKRADGSVEYWFANPNATRLVFGPTGRSLARGEGYFADYDIVVGSVAVGITDRITIGGGLLLVPNSRLWFVTPKFGVVQREDFNLSVGVLYGGWGGTGAGGVGYVVGTFGGTDKSLTFGVGNGFSGSGAARDQVFILGGEARASRRVSFISENYLTTASSDALLSYGIRFLGERFAVDVAFFNLAREMVFPGIPFVGVAVKF